MHIHALWRLSCLRPTLLPYPQQCPPHRCLLYLRLCTCLLPPFRAERVLSIFVNFTASGPLAIMASSLVCQRSPLFTNCHGLLLHDLLWSGVVAPPTVRPPASFLSLAFQALMEPTLGTCKRRKPWPSQARSLWFKTSRTHKADLLNSKTQRSQHKRWNCQSTNGHHQNTYRRRKDNRQSNDWTHHNKQQNADAKVEQGASKQL